MVYRGGDCACHATSQMKGTYVMVTSASAANLVPILKFSIVIEIFWECDIPSPVLNSK